MQSHGQRSTTRGVVAKQRPAERMHQRALDGVQWPRSPGSTAASRVASRCFGIAGLSIRHDASSCSAKRGAMCASPTVSAVSWRTSGGFVLAMLAALGAGSVGTRAFRQRARCAPLTARASPSRRGWYHEVAGARRALGAHPHRPTSAAFRSVVQRTLGESDDMHLTHSRHADYTNRLACAACGASRVACDRGGPAERNPAAHDACRARAAPSVTF